MATAARPRLGRFSEQGAVLHRLASAGVRFEELNWLGPFTPDWVPDYIRKRMRRDPQIQLGLTALKSPFYGITYRAEGGSAATRAFVQTELIGADWFKRLIGSILNALDFGRQAHEIIWAIKDVEVDEDGEGPMEPRTFHRAYGYDAIEDLDPEHTTIIIDRISGDFAALQTSGKRIPAGKAVLASYRPEWKNWLGTALIDAAYLPWFWANHCYVFANRHLELKGDPPLIGEAPSEPPHDPDVAFDDQNPDDPVREMGLILANLRGSGTCVLPSDVDDNGNKMYSIQELTLSARADLFLKMIQHYQDLKLRALLVPERIVTQESTIGSFAMQQGMLDVFFSNLQTILEDLILTTINEQLVRPLVVANFGRCAPMPRVTASEISKQNKKLLAELVKATLNEPRKTVDGRVYTGSQLIDMVDALKSLNMPTRPVDAVAQEPAPGQLPDAQAADEAVAAARAGEQIIPPSPEELATFQESTTQIASAYGVGRGTVARWASMGAPCIRLPGAGAGRIRFNRKKLAAWLEDKQAERLAQHTDKDEEETDAVG